MSVQLADVIDVLDAAYPPWLAQDWDSVGLVCGDPAESVETVTVAVDATAAVVAEVPARGLLLAHHPLLLHGVDTVAASTAKGALVHQMIRSWRALFTAHTNADAASPGVSDALADALGLTVDEVLAPIAVGADVGLGRVGVLPRPEPLSAFVSRVHDALPGTSWGVRASGDSEATVSRVAVCGGAGDSLLDTVAGAGVQAYVTADLRHHPAAEHLLAGTLPGRPTPALVDVAHWASEWPWCAQAANVVRAALPGRVDVHVSRRRTNPRTLAAR
jgi:dinuclear metal center YbgI/SA1388 family protein